VTPAGRRDPDGVTVVIEVAVDPATAFEVFTSEIGTWYRPSASARGHTQIVRFEDGLEDGPSRRLVTVHDDGRVHPLGTVVTWEPTPRLVLDHTGPDLSPEHPTEVEVRFEAMEGGTRVVLEHRGFATDTTRSEWEDLLDRFATQTLERALVAFQQEFVAAICANDVDYFRSNLAEDALLVWSAGVQDKEACVASIRTHAAFQKFDIAEPRVVTLGDDSAVLTYKATWQHEGDDHGESGYMSTAYVRRPGGWRLAFLQSTPIADPPEPNAPEPNPIEEER